MSEPKRSQVSCVGKPHPKTWHEYEEGCLSTFSGGHSSDGMLDAYRHGMSTVFNLLRAEFPAAETIQSDTPVSRITLCYQFGYHDKPFVKGVRDDTDVWLRDDGVWTEDETDERIGLAVNLSFYPG